MPTKDGFTPDHPLPLFLSEERGQPDIGKAWDRAVIIQSRSLRTLQLRCSTHRRFSLVPVNRRQQFNQPPTLRPCRRLQGTRRRATKLLSLLDLPIRVRPKAVSRQLKTC